MEFRIYVLIFIVFVVYLIIGVGMVFKYFVFEFLFEINCWVWVNFCVRGIRFIGCILDV